MTMHEAGTGFSDIGRALGVYYMTVAKWWYRYQVGGMKALAMQTRGPRTGTHRRLTARQEQPIQCVITDTTPDQLKLPFALWTRVAVVQLVQQKFGIALPVRTMGHCLQQWAFTAQKPIQRV